MPGACGAVHGDAGVYLLMLHHAGKAEQRAHAAAGAGAPYGAHVFGGKNAGQHVSVGTRTDNGDHAQLTRYGYKREEFVVPQAEDETLSPRVYGIYFLTVFLTDAEGRADGGIKVGEECGGECWRKMHVSLFLPCSYIIRKKRLPCRMALTEGMIAHIIPMFQWRKTTFFRRNERVHEEIQHVAEGIRLNKALADAGVCSRRRADELVFAGRVRINGTPAESPGQRVLPGDTVSLDGRVIRLKEESAVPCWLMLNKPVRIVSTASDPEGRETVIDLVPEPWRQRRLFPVGRLDFFSEGLILLTDDGELAHRLTHPRWHLSKVYHVLVRPERGEASVSAALSLMRRGMILSEGDRLAPVDVRVLPSSSSRGLLLEMVLHQGLNRQIRRMCRDVEFTVLRLKRVKEGPLELGSLPPGRVRELSAEEVSALRRSVGLESATTCSDARKREKRA